MHVKRFAFVACALAACGADGGTPKSDSGLDADADVPAGCEEGDDTDFDGLADAEECELGFDPYNPDMDGDGVRDGVEVNYPRICVAMLWGAQRREPFPSCESDDDCLENERCLGLDPRTADSDGDGVSDSAEDPTFDAEIDPNRGETDPRVFDTDGDGQPDASEGLFLCRADGLAMPDVVRAPSGTVQLALDMAWSESRDLPAGSGGESFVVDDVSAEVAGVLVELVPSSQDVQGEAQRIDEAVASSLPEASGVLLGRPFVTHDGFDAIVSFYRLTGTGSAAALRDALAAQLAGGFATPSTETWRSPGVFYLEITTTFRTNEDDEIESLVVLAAVAPADSFDDRSKDTAIRVRDFTNATGLSRVDQELDFSCDSSTTERLAQADFLWTVDISGSMDQDQENLGRVAGNFFEHLVTAGIDFRVGVLEANEEPLDLDANRHCSSDATGFRFIAGDSSSGVEELQYEVTKSRYLSMVADDCVPYGPQTGDASEQPIAAAVQAIEEFEAQREAGETDPDRTLREDATVVTFFVTDESGQNDDDRFFATDVERPRWGETAEDRYASIVDFFSSRSVLTFGLVNDFGNECPAVEDLPKCTILGAGGAFIPIDTAEESEVGVALDRIVEAVAGASSSYVCSQTPISATLQVAVNGTEIPRSRQSGFDYDAASNAVVFHGPTYRPDIGDEVVLSYRIWKLGGFE